MSSLTIKCVMSAVRAVPPAACSARRRDTDAERFSSKQIQWIPTGAK